MWWALAPSVISPGHRAYMDSILILDFGSQYTQLIARRVRELNTYAEIKPWNGDWRNLLDTPPEEDDLGRRWKGVILSGSPHSVRETEAPSPDLEGVRGKWPVLGVCFGAQWLAHHGGGLVEASDSREYGRAHLSEIDTTDRLFSGMTPGKQAVGRVNITSVKLTRPTACFRG